MFFVCTRISSRHFMIDSNEKKVHLISHSDSLFQHSRPNINEQNQIIDFILWEMGMKMDSSLPRTKHTLKANCSAKDNHHDYQFWLLEKMKSQKRVLWWIVSCHVLQITSTSVIYSNCLYLHEVFLNFVLLQTRLKRLFSRTISQIKFFLTLCVAAGKMREKKRNWKGRIIFFLWNSKGQNPQLNN